MEIVTNYRLKERHIDTLEVMNIRKAESSAMGGGAVKKREKERSEVEEKEINLMKAKCLLVLCLRTMTGQFARKWKSQKSKNKEIA